ncbi:MAG: hypothetical protein UHL07_07010 [Bacteroidaceae bacterium]|nr:hypothetical protein [Bacteroidaceae bacterium]
MAEVVPFVTKIRFFYLSRAHIDENVRRRNLKLRDKFSTESLSVYKYNLYVHSEKLFRTYVQVFRREFVGEKQRFRPGRPTKTRGSTLQWFPLLPPLAAPKTGGASAKTNQKLRFYLFLRSAFTNFALYINKV